MRPGDVAAVVLVAEALLIDVVLVRRERDTISTCIRRSWAAKALTLAVCAHLLFSLPHDPLRWAAGKIAR